MPIKSSGQISLQEIAAEYRDPVPHDVFTLASLTDGMTAGAQTGFNSFYGKSSAFAAPTYTSQQIVGVYFANPGVDRDVYWAVDITSMANWFYTFASDFYWDSFSYSNPNLIPIMNPNNYSSVTLNVSGSSGRPIVSVHQQPTAQNGWIGIVRADDNPYGSRSPSNIIINVTTTGTPANFDSVNLWFNKTGIRADPITTSQDGYGGPGNVTTVSALFHPRVTPISFSWTGASGFNLTNTTSQTVTITNPNTYRNGNYAYIAPYNIARSPLTCTATLRYNNINYVISRTIYIHARVQEAPVVNEGGGW